LALSLSGVQLCAQDSNYVIHDTRAVIFDGPYLVAPEEDSVTVVWTTDTPCQSRVDFGPTSDLGQSAESSDHGLVRVGTLHAVRLTGLEPGRTYFYRVVSTRVVKLKPYWPEKGQPVESPVYSFQTLDQNQDKVSFAVITDTQHEDLGRLEKHLEAVEWEGIDFLVHTGDALDWVRDEEQMFQGFIRPLSARLEHGKPLVFARGNHDARGPFARKLYDYLPTGTGEFYYAFDAGPIHFLVLDSGEDKADSTNVYAELNRFEEYRDREFRWLDEHTRTCNRMRTAPFRVILLHSPTWGWQSEGSDRWARLATRTGVDLVIAGHRHRLSRTDASEQGEGFTLLVIGQDQVGRVEASPTELRVSVTDASGVELEAFRLAPGGSSHPPNH
jgi:predicted phosphodiesterase